MKNNKIVNIRALAIIIVVLGHSIILYSTGWGFYQSSYSVPFLDKLKNLINMVQMPLFFSISGFLFYYSINKKIQLKDFIIKKAKRLLLPFIIIGICWMIPIKLMVNYIGYQSLSILQIIKALILGTDSGHLWYLPTLFIIFIIAILTKKFWNKNFPFDLLIAIILLIISYLSIYLNVYSYLNQAVQYLYYFYIGALLNKYSNKNINSYFLCGVTIFIFILIFFFKDIKILQFIFATMFIWLIYQIMSNKKNRIIEIISENSYGIYLIHSPLIYITYTYLTNANPIIVVFINFVIFGTISLLLSMLIRKTKIKFILGEN